MALLLYIILLFILYSNLIFYYWKNWESLPEFKKSLQTATIKISIIIPARNEEQNIGQLLKRLQNQTYPSHLFEIIVVDDHSTDRTREIVQQFSTILLIALKEENLNSYKKKAI
jgi:cellulose synthase/poly-beta-1,6-N-acetylglucosamine synthase-like glycosyltransferase